MHRRVWIHKATLHFCIISWISLVNAGGQCRSQLSINGETLKGHSFASSLVNSAIECFIKCENEPKCQSYNYFISRKLCELNNRTKDAKPLDLVPDPDGLYMTRWFDRGKFEFFRIIFVRRFCCYLSFSSYHFFISSPGFHP